MSVVAMSRLANVAWVSLALASGCGRIGFDLGGVPGGTGDGGGSGTGDGAVDGDISTTPFNIVFVTSTSSRPADLGGVAGADATCNALAAAADLPGTYVAWLPSPLASAASRLGTARGWVRVDGRPVVDTVADLLAGNLLHPILLSETGGAMTGQFGVATGTSSTGAAVEDCSDLMSTGAGETIMTGIASATKDTWTQNFASACDQQFSHYCFGVERSTPLSFTSATGPRAFVMAALWAPAGGVAAADSACQGAADAEMLDGTWRALMATTTDTAASRFSAAGAPWVRLDGIPIVAARSDLLDGNHLAAPLNLTETGSYRGSNPAHTGATSATVLGASNSTCVDWTSAAAGETQRVGLLNSITLYFTTPIFQTCNALGHLYCLEP